MLSRGGQDWYRYDGETTWQFDGDLPVAQPGFRLPSWEGITLLALDSEDFYQEIGEYTRSESELLGRPTFELSPEPRISVIVDQETGIPMGIRSPRAPLIPTKFEILPGALDAAWRGPLKEVAVPAEWSGRAVDKLPAVDGELRIWGHACEIVDRIQVGSTVPMPLEFSDGDGFYPGTAQTWRGWVHIDSAAPDPRWRGLFVTLRFTAGLTTQFPLRGDRELSGTLSYMDSPDMPITYVQVRKIYGVARHPDAEQTYFLPVSEVDAVEIDGWDISEFIMDGCIAEAPPLVAQKIPKYGFILADDTSLWAQHSQVPLIDSYDLDTGAFQRQVIIPAPVRSHCALHWDETRSEVAVRFDNHVFFPASGRIFELEPTDTLPRIEFEYDPAFDSDSIILVTESGQVALTNPRTIKPGWTTYFRLDAFEAAGIIVAIVDDRVRFFTPDLTETTIDADIDFRNSQRFQDVMMEYSEVGARFFRADDLSLLAQIGGDTDGNTARIVRGACEHVVILRGHDVYQWRPQTGWTKQEFDLD